MKINYDLGAIGNRGNLLPAYNNYLNYYTQPITGGKWIKLTNFRIQDRLNNKPIENRAAKRIFLTTMVSNGYSDVYHGEGLLNVQAWCDTSGQLKTNISLIDLTANDNINDLYEFRIYWRRNPDTSGTFDIELWGTTTEDYGKIVLHPIKLQMPNLSYNPYNSLYNLYSNEYEKLECLFDDISTQTLKTETERDNDLSSWNFNRTGRLIYTNSSTEGEIYIASGMKILNLGSSNSSQRLITKVHCNYGAFPTGYRMSIISVNNLAIKNSGTIMTPPADDGIVCPGNKDYIMETNELIELIKVGKYWVLIK